MAYCIIIRGPLGVGKTTIAKKLSKILKAKYISIDQALSKKGLDKIDKKKDCIPVENFIIAIESIIPKIKPVMKKNRIIVFDGNFYYRRQITHLKKNLDCKIYVFTIKASLDACIKRDSKRKNTYGKSSAEAVHKLVSRFDYGTRINTENKASGEVIKEILDLLPKQNKMGLK